MGDEIGYLGIDIGGTKVAMRAEGVDLPPRDIVFLWPSVADAEADLAELAGRVQRLQRDWREPIDAVGVALPATLDRSGRVIAWPGRPGWVGVEAGARLRDIFPQALVSYADDGDLAALAEAHEANCRDLVYLGVGTGVGGGVVLDGRSCPGPARGSCEIGHVVVDRSGPQCDCGRHGCLQAIASGPATLRRAAGLAGHDVKAADLVEGFRLGAPWAVSAVDETCAALAAVAVSMGELLHPSLVLIGGGFAAALPGLAPAVARHTRRLARSGHPPPPIRPAALGGLSSLHGAVLLARDLAERRTPERADF